MTEIYDGISLGVIKLLKGNNMFTEINRKYFIIEIKDDNEIKIRFFKKEWQAERLYQKLIDKKIDVAMYSRNISIKNTLIKKAEEM